MFATLSLKGLDIKNKRKIYKFERENFHTQYNNKPAIKHNLFNQVHRHIFLFLSY